MNIDFKFNNKNIILYLGEQNFETAESAILEIVKNSYDAGAKVVTINIDENKIEFIDDGLGMNYEDIETKWMNIGTSYKEYKGPKDRVMSGNKGIGRFALARLGKNAVLESKKKECSGVKWITDWSNNEVLEEEHGIEIGTKIVVEQLNDVWTSNSIKKIYSFLNKMLKVNDITIYINDFINAEKYTVINIFDSIPDIGYLKFSFEISESIEIKIENTMFSEEVAKKYGFKLEDKLLISKEEKFNKLEDVMGIFYFSFQRQEKHVERFKYKNVEKNTLPGILETNGIIMYRNAFSVNGYDGSIDWSGLQQRVQSSPAAATHPKGKFRFRKNNIVGYIGIDKKKHYMLEDLSNRQGLIKNDAFYDLRELLDNIFSEVELYYQNIIRTIDSYTKKEDEKELLSIEKVIKKYSNISKDSKEYDKFTTAQRETALVVKHTNNLTERIGDLQYDLAMMETLATQAILILSTKHDLKKEYADIPGSMQTILRKLRDYSDDNINLVKEIASDTEVNFKRFINKMDNFLNNVRREKLKFSNLKISDYFEEFKKFWIIENSELNINICANEDIIHIDKNTLDILFYNLVTNTIKHNENRNNLTIDIEVEKVDDKLIFKYKDYGKGLEDKYRDGNEYKIFDILNRTRNEDVDGNGLGMWIFERRLEYMEGKVLEVNGEDGFSIKFYLKEHNENKYITYR